MWYTQNLCHKKLRSLLLRIILLYHPSTITIDFTDDIDQKMCATPNGS